MPQTKVNKGELYAMPFMAMNGASNEYTQIRGSDWNPLTNLIPNTDITFTPTVDMKVTLMLSYSAAYGGGSYEFSPAICIKVGSAAMTVLYAPIGNIMAADWANQRAETQTSLTAGVTYLFQGGVSTSTNRNIRHRQLLLIAVPV